MVLFFYTANIHKNIDSLNVDKFIKFRHFVWKYDISGPLGVDDLYHESGGETIDILEEDDANLGSKPELLRSKYVPNIITPEFEGRGLSKIPSDMYRDIRSAARNHGIDEKLIEDAMDYIALLISSIISDYLRSKRDLSVYYSGIFYSDKKSFFNNPFAESLLIYTDDMPDKIQARNVIVSFLEAVAERAIADESEAIEFDMDYLDIGPATINREDELNIYGEECKDKDGNTIKYFDDEGYPEECDFESEGDNNSPPEETNGENSGGDGENGSGSSNNDPEDTESNMWIYIIIIVAIIIFAIIAGVIMYYKLYV